MRRFLIGCEKFVRSIMFQGMYNAMTLLMARLLRGTFYIQPKGYPTALTIRGKTSDPEVFHGIFCRKWYYPNLHKAPVHNVIDAGANVGYASVYFAHVFPDAKILAIEPEESNYASLLENIRAYPSIKAVKGAVWPVSTTVYIDDPTVEKWMFTCSENSSDEKESGVAAYTITELMEAYDMTIVDALKIDIEGAERELFSKHTGWLSRVRTISIEIHKHCWKSVFDALTEYPYDCQIFGQNIFIRFRNASN